MVITYYIHSLITDDDKSDSDEKPDISKIDLDSGNGTKTRSSVKSAAKKSPVHTPPIEDVKPTLSNGEIIEDVSTLYASVLFELKIWILNTLK